MTKIYFPVSFNRVTGKQELAEVSTVGLWRNSVLSLISSLVVSKLYTLMILTETSAISIQVQMPPLPISHLCDLGKVIWTFWNSADPVEKMKGLDEAGGSGRQGKPSKKHVSATAFLRNMPKPYWKVLEATREKSKPWGSCWRCHRWFLLCGLIFPPI